MAADRNVLELHKVYKGFARIGTDELHNGQFNC